MVESGNKDAKDEHNEIDFILKDIGGTFGKFQIYNYLMLSYSMFVTGTYIYDYVFATLDVGHRCAIPECESVNNVNNVMFNPDWLKYSVPFHENDRPDSCHRFEMAHTESVGENSCRVDSFNRSAISHCGNGPKIFRTDEVSIVTKFDITCDENRWKLAMVGTYSNIGRLLFLSLLGYVSDRFGRKTVLVTSTLLSSIIKIGKSFASSYSMFVAFEVLDAGVCAGIYPASLILGMEWATSEHTILVTCIVLASYPCGAVLIACLAAYLHNYQWLLRVISLLGFVTIPYIWTIPESFRWLLVNRKYDEAVKVVEKAAKINGLELSPKTYEIIKSKCQGSITNETTKKEDDRGSFTDILTSCSLLTRLLICAFCWVSGTFVTYGVSIISVSLPGDKYINFLVVSLGGAPGIFLTYFMLKYLGRRWAMSTSLFVTGVSILASKFLSSYGTISLIFFFIGKLFIHHTFTSLYLYTNEMWPTAFRHRVLGICSTIGRFGSIAAPLAPLLISVMEMLPFYLFSGFAFLSGLMILFLPETFRQGKLPDSINDIKNLQKQHHQQKQLKQQRP